LHQKIYRRLFQKNGLGLTWLGNKQFLHDTDSQELTGYNFLSYIQHRQLIQIERSYGKRYKEVKYRIKNAWNYNAQFPQYQVGCYNLENGETSRVTSRYGSAFTPTMSPDGKWMVYGTRFEDETGLILRNLENGDESWLAYPVQRDEQESIAPLGVLPAMSFTPDSQFLVVSYDGKIFKINISDKSATEISFEAEVDLPMGPRLAFKFPIEDEEEMLVTQIRDAVPSPDGAKLAFTALNKLYLMQLCIL